MSFDGFFKHVANVVNKNRPADSEPVVFVPSNDDVCKEDTNKSPLWTKNTKRTVIFVLIIIGLVCTYFLRNMITPLIFSCLIVFYLKPIVYTIQERWKISHKFSVVIVFGIFLMIFLAIITLSGFSVYTQIANLFETLNNSMDNLPMMVADFLGGDQSVPGKYFLNFIGISQNSELNQQLEGIFQNIGSNVLTFVQNFSSKLGWFFFAFGFSFFLVWESPAEKKDQKLTPKSGYDYDIEMGKFYLSQIWRRFLWGQAILLIIALAVYTILYVVLGVKYAFILAVVVALTRMIPYIGSFFAWAAVGLVALFQETGVFGLKSLPYAVMVVLISFLIDKFMDGFIQPKFLADTLKIHPAAVLASALICGRTMGFLGIFLSAPIAATIKLCARYILCKLRDEDPWENIEIVEEPLPLKTYFANYKRNFIEIYDKLLYNIRNVGARLLGGKGHGSNGF